MTRLLDRRVTALRARVLARSWDYRQRDHARGVWYRLRRVLADASAAFAVPTVEVARLVAEGHRVETVGREFEPPKAIVFAPAARVAQIASARAVPLRLGRELLEAEGLVLTPFETTT